MSYLVCWFGGGDGDGLVEAEASAVVLVRVYVCEDGHVEPWLRALRRQRPSLRLAELGKTHVYYKKPRITF